MQYEYSFKVRGLVRPASSFEYEVLPLLKSSAAFGGSGLLPSVLESARQRGRAASPRHAETARIVRRVRPDGPVLVDHTALHRENSRRVQSGRGRHLPDGGRRRGQAVSAHLIHARA